MRRPMAAGVLAGWIGLLTIAGCDERDLLVAPPPPGVIESAEAVEPLPDIASAESADDGAIGDSDGGVAGVRTGPMPGFVNWDDDLDPDGLAVQVMGVGGTGDAIAIKSGRLVMTLYTDRGNRVERRGRPVMQWTISADAFEARRVDTPLTGPALDLKLAIDRRLDGGYYSLETRLIVPDGRQFEAVDPALWLQWRQGGR